MSNINSDIHTLLQLHNFFVTEYKTDQFHGKWSTRFNQLSISLQDHFIKMEMTHWAWAQGKRYARVVNQFVDDAFGWPDIRREALKCVRDLNFYMMNNKLVVPNDGIYIPNLIQEMMVTLLVQSLCRSLSEQN